MSVQRPDLLVSGPSQHGVVRYARELAQASIDAHAASGLQGLQPRLLESSQESRPGHPLHLHFTDRLFGATPEEAAASVERIAAITPVSVTLHDVPQPSDGVINLPRRCESYRRVIAAARGAVCNSFHELALLQELGIVAPHRKPAVIPLPAHPPQQDAVDDDELDAMAALVGFVYPGKGHREVIDAAARLGAVLDVVALGAASAGHEGDLVALASHAASLGVTFTATGYLSDDELHRLCRRAAVPIAAHQHLSASGSILAWLSAGRLPLVLDSRYAREMLALRPGTMTLYAANGMDAAIAAALADPRSTILPANIGTAPHVTDVVTSYGTWWDGIAW